MLIPRHCAGQLFFYLSILRNGVVLVVLTFAAIALWGLGFGAIPTTSQTWASRAEPHRVEAAGGLFVANFQLAIALGAALGGALLDQAGVGTVFLAGAAAVVLGGALFASTRRLLPR